MRDLRTLCFRFDGRAIKAIANFDSIVVCHASEEIFGDDALSIALPAALRRRGWVRVYHLCETATVDMYADLSGFLYGFHAIIGRKHLTESMADCFVTHWHSGIGIMIMTLTILVLGTYLLLV